MIRIEIEQSSKTFYSGCSGLVRPGNLINGYTVTVHTGLSEAGPVGQRVRSAPCHFLPWYAPGPQLRPRQGADLECQQAPFGRILTYEMGSVHPATRRAQRRNWPAAWVQLTTGS